MSAIDHEAAKEAANFIISFDQSDDVKTDLAYAYLARDSQVGELAELVKVAFTEGRRTGMDHYETGGSKYGFGFYESPVSDELARILGAEEGQ